MSKDTVLLIVTESCSMVRGIKWRLDRRDDYCVTDRDHRWEYSNGGNLIWPHTILCELHAVPKGSTCVREGCRSLYVKSSGLRDHALHPVSK